MYIMCLSGKYNPEKTMTIRLSQNSDVPIYEQIENQIRSGILSGSLKAGEALPSMRCLAKDLRVSVITVQKAYENLTKNGYISTGVGRGSFVSSISSEFVKEEMLRRIEDHIGQAVELARENGIEKSTVDAILSLYFEE